MIKKILFFYNSRFDHISQKMKMKTLYQPNGSMTECPGTIRNLFFRPFTPEDFVANCVWIMPCFAVWSGNRKKEKPDRQNTIVLGWWEELKLYYLLMSSDPCLGLKQLNAVKSWRWQGSNENTCKYVVSVVWSQDLPDMGARSWFGWALWHQIFGSRFWKVGTAGSRLIRTNTTKQKSFKLDEF